MGLDLLFTRAPQYILYTYAYNWNIRYLDLLPYFLSHPRKSDLYLVNDNHLSSIGHEVAFGVIKNILLESIRDSSEVADFKDKGIRDFDFSDVLIGREMEIIRSDSTWYADILKKARENKRNAEDQLYLDAKYMVDVYGALK